MSYITWIMKNNCFLHVITIVEGLICNTNYSLNSVRQQHCVICIPLHHWSVQWNANLRQRYQPIKRNIQATTWNIYGKVTESIVENIAMIEHMYY